MDAQVLKDLISLICKLFKFATIFKKAKYWIIYYFHSPINVILFGESGTGKSQLANCITGNNLTSKKRTRVITPKTFTLPNGRRIKIMDTPGHKTYTTQRKELCQKYINKKKVRGIINIVSYGYHETDAADEVKIFKTGTSEVKEEYLRENRNREIEQINEWIDYIIHENVQWIITIINKADIWYKDYSIVKNFYENGDYSSKLKELVRLCPHHTFIYCSVIAPFYNKPMTIVIGEDKKKEMHDELLENILQIINDNAQY